MLAEKIGNPELVECIVRTFAGTRIGRLSDATSLASQLCRA